MRRVLAVLAILFVLAASAAGAGAYYVWKRAEAFAVAPLSAGSDVTKLVTIPRGATVRDIARILHEESLLDEPELFVLWVRYFRRGQAAGIKSGEYELQSSLNPDQLLGKLIRGEVATVRVTIPEGWNLWDIAPAIEESGLAKAADFLAYAQSPAAARALGLPPEATSLEGYLFPDTYQYARGVGLPEICGAMVKKYRGVFEGEVKPALAGVGLTEHQAVTLASIVEKETGAPQERPHIASVFHNRLKKAMRLETDPTVIYAVRTAGLLYAGNIHKEDLLRDIPYNTYKRPGLPPGPIASPGRSALVAVVHPMDANDLFFVSHNDGTHEFCPTFDCHEKAVEKWQRQYFRKNRDKPRDGGADAGLPATPPR